MIFSSNCTAKLSKLQYCNGAYGEPRGGWELSLVLEGGVFGAGWGDPVGVSGGGGGGGAAFLVSTFMCFLTVFAKLYLERGTAHYAMSPPKFEIFLIFPYFLGNQAFYTRYHVSFYL